MREHCTSRKSKSIPRQVKKKNTEENERRRNDICLRNHHACKQNTHKNNPQTCSNRHRLLSWRQQLHQILEMDEPNVEARSLNLLMKLIQPLAVRAAPGKHGLRVHHEYRPLHTIGLL